MDNKELNGTEQVTVLNWISNGGGANYRLFGPAFWADVHLPWNPETGWGFEYLHGNYNGDLTALSAAAVSAIGVSA